MSWKYLLILVALVPFSFSYSKPTASVGDMAVVKGDVKIKSTTTNGAALKAKVGSPVNEGDTIIAGKDSRAKIAMRDGNIIHISPDTTFTVSKYENDGSQKNVELNLNAGKIRNEVNQKYDGDKNKFLIKTPTAVAGVRGTDFITSHNVASGQTKVITFSGKVEFSNIPNSSGAAPVTVLVTKGESAETSSFQPPSPPMVIDKMELKKIDQETKAPDNNGLGPDNNPSQQPNGPEKNKDKEKNKKDKQPGKINEVRVDDKQDQSPNTFEKLPELQKPPVAGVTPPPTTFVPPPPSVNNLPADAIRQQNEKTKVIIKPQ